MARYYGTIGFAVQGESAPGVWQDIISERQYSGDVIRDTHKWQSTEHLNDNFTVSNQISIVADVYALENFPSIKFVTWMGNKWRVSNVEVNRPRLIMTIGGIYNG